MAENGAESAAGELVEAVTAAAAVAELEDRARRLAKESRAAATWRAYDSDLRHFRAWCADRQLESLPADPLTVAAYLAALEQTHRPSTIRRRLASISVAHQVTGLETPTADAGVRAVWAGIRRRHGTAPSKVRAARTKVVTTMVAPLGDRLADVRDRALLLIGFAGAPPPQRARGDRRRRRERGRRRAADRAAPLEDGPGGRDQDGRAAVRLAPRTCPVRAWRAWLAASGVDAGPAFRAVDRHGRMRSTRLSDRAVADMVKRRAAAVGLDGLFAGHSMRAGFATEAYAQAPPSRRSCATAGGRRPP